MKKEREKSSRTLSTKSMSASASTEGQSCSVTASVLLHLVSSIATTEHNADHNSAAVCGVNTSKTQLNFYSARICFYVVADS